MPERGTSVFTTISVKFNVVNLVAGAFAQARKFSRCPDEERQYSPRFPRNLMLVVWLPEQSPKHEMSAVARAGNVSIHDDFREI